KQAARKLREWTGERGVYSKLFDQHTTLKTDADWLFFNVERLSDDPRLETAMSMMIAHAMQERASGRSGQHSITVLDECWSLLDSNVLAPRSEEHTSEPQSRSELVCRLLLEKKKDGHQHEREMNEERQIGR